MFPDLPANTQPLVVSYVGLRRAIGLSALVLPIVLGPVGLMLGVPIQDNMSSYYHTPLRDVFVGTLFAIGIFLFCYRGHDRAENWTANLGFVSAIGIALLPLDPNSDPLYQHSWVGYMHTVCGTVFFLTLAFYSLYHFPRSSAAEGDDAARVRNLIYITSGLTILASLLAMGAYLFLLSVETREQLNRFHFLFWGEWIAVWAFSAAWLTKGRAMVANIAVELVALGEAQIKRRLEEQKAAKWQHEEKK